MRRVVRSDWTVLALGLALLATLWLPWDDDDTGWQSFTYTDVSVCLAAATAFALWMTEGERWPALVAPVASAVALMGVVASVVDDGFAAAGPRAGLGCALALTACCFAATRFARWRSADWSVDIAAAALLVAMFLPWLENPADGFYFGYRGHDDAWQWFTYADLLLLLAVVTALASVHARGPLADPWIPVRAAAVATVAVVVGLVGMLRGDPAFGGEIEVRFGAPIGVACALALFATTLSAARSGDLGEPRRGGVPALD